MILLAAVASPAWATFPGYNGRIAFGCGEDICLINADGSGIERFVSGYGPAWSPDGRHLAFRRSYGDLFVVRADGRGLRQVLDNPAEERFPPTHSLTWSRDGRRLVFAQGGRLTVLNVTTGRLQEIGDAGELAYAWSPDETRIAFSRRVPVGCPGVRAGAVFRNGCNPDQPELWGMRSDGTGVIRYAGPTTGTRPDWSPDGQRILFATSPHGVRAIRADGTPLSQPALETGDSASWSPDGKKFVFVDLGAYVQVAGADGQDTPTTLTGPWGGAGQPAWQPLREIASLRLRRNRVVVECGQGCLFDGTARTPQGRLVARLRGTLVRAGERGFRLPRRLRLLRLRVDVVDVAGNEATLRRRIRLRR